MSDLELVKMSGKGQLVVPLAVRSSAKLNPGERFIAFPVKEGVLFRKVKIPKVDFDSVAQEVQTQFNKQSVRKKDVREALKWARKE